jgi:hypothetical protein
MRKYLMLLLSLVTFIAVACEVEKVAPDSETITKVLSGGSQTVTTTLDLAQGADFLPLEKTFVQDTVPEATFVVSTPSKFTLSDYVDAFFEPEDKDLILRIVWCESTGYPEDTSSDAINKSSGASGWFQHLPKFWEERTEAAGIAGAEILDPVANVLVASYLFYHTPQRSGHWYPSEHCWG